MTSAGKVAVVTGGASGMGLEVTTQLIQKGGWIVHVLDVNAAMGDAAVQKLGSKVEFHNCDVSSYPKLSTAFDEIFNCRKRIDFVFANAGIIEKVDFFAKHPPTGPPPELDQFVIKVNLQSVINTTYLALHYFRQCPEVAPHNIVITGSVGSLYPTFSIPMYCAAKHGLLGFVRSIDRYLFAENIRVNALLPGLVLTGLLTDEELATYPQDAYIPPELIGQTVLGLIGAEDMVDSKGRKVAGNDLHGQAVEVSIRNIYFRDQPEWCDDKMEAVMEATDR